MNIYENIVKQCNIIVFIINSEGIIVDTNVYTMALLDRYDISGQSFYSFFDDMSALKIKSCLMSEYFESMEVNLLMSNKDMKLVTMIFNKINNYTIALGVSKVQKTENLSRQLQEINSRMVILENKDTLNSNGLSNEHDKRMWQLNNIDPLTGLYNRNFFDSIFESHYNNVLQSGENIGIICLNIKDIGSIINEYGQQKANSIMAGFSQIILTSIRSTDYAIKYNNNFLVVVTNTNREVLKKVSQRISSGAYENLSVSLDIGIACTIDSKVLDKWDLIKEAYDNIDDLPMITGKLDKF